MNEIKRFFKKNKSLKIGIIVGIVLAVLNQFTVGLIGGLALAPIFLPASYISYRLGGPSEFVEILFRCSGESCWGFVWVIGTIWLIVLPAAIGYFIGRRKKNE